MGLFAKKREKDEELELPPMKPSLSDFPRYESTIKSPEFKPEFRPNIEIPMRKPERFNEEKQMPVNEKRGDALFVQVTQYKDVMQAMDKIKEKVREAEKHLEKIESIRQQEQSEIDNWKSELDEIKDKLGSIYKTLFY